MKTTKKANGKKVRTVAFLTREELDFVDNLSKDAINCHTVTLSGL